MATLHADDALPARTDQQPLVHLPEHDDERVAEVLSKVHHDLKNPLSIISGNAQFLMEVGKEAGWDDQAMASLKDIEEAAERLSSSLDQLSELRESL